MFRVAQVAGCPADGVEQYAASATGAERRPAPPAVQVDLVSQAEQRHLLSLLRTLNPGADILPTTQSQARGGPRRALGSVPCPGARWAAGWGQQRSERPAAMRARKDAALCCFASRVGCRPGTSWLTTLHACCADAAEPRHQHRALLL